MTKLILIIFVLLTCVCGCAGFKDWKHLPASKHEERTIHVVSHGWHTGIVLPQQDLGDELDFIKEYLTENPYYEFGWGEADFYQAEKITTSLVLKALFWRNPTVMHVVAVSSPPEKYFNQSEVVELHLSETGLKHLKKSLRASFKLNKDQHPYPLKPGLYGESRFFKAEGYYFITNTCNSWTGNLMENAGIPMDSVLTLRAGSIISQARDAKERYTCCPNSGSNN